MRPSEYKEVVEFLTGQFAQSDRRFHDQTLELSRRLTAVDERIASFRAEMEERFGEVSGRFDGLYRHLERLEQYHVLSEQLRRMETALSGDAEGQASLERELAHLRERVNVIQVRLDDIDRRLRP